ncbi:MAG: C4-dicarboxylate TRAP transporter substrate-binding protein [Deltaproteobacteria bacterium]|nr:C4-dicarboxylate TRAP transporter substrate-binding protein [Deltaproteobacteria bacterium]
MRVKLSSIVTLVLALSLWVGLGAGPAWSADKTLVLRYAAQGAPKGVRATAVKWWASEIEKRSKGKVKIKFFWSGALLKPGDAMEGIGARTADMGGAWGIYHPAKTPLWTVGDPPFSHDDPYVGLATMREMFKTYKPLVDELAKYNVKVLAPFVTGMTQLGTTKKEVFVPADTKGMKIRFAGGQWAKFWKSVDAVPIKLTQGEVYEALMRGTADATQSYFFILEAYKHWDVIKYYSVINAGELCSYGLAINLQLFNSFSPELKKIFTQVSDEFVDRYAKGLIDVRKKVIPLGEKKGMKFLYLNKDQRGKWLAAAKPFMEAWAKAMDDRGLPGTKTQQEFLSLAAKYKKQVEAKGYPWGK